MHDIKSGYYLELLTPEAMKLFEITEEKITKNMNGKTVPHVEITEVVLVHCNIINKKYQHDLRVLSTLILNKSLNISPANHIYSKTFCSVLHTLKYGSLIKTLSHLQIEDRTNLTLVINDAGI